LVRVLDPDPNIYALFFGNWIWIRIHICIRMKSLIRIRISALKSKFRSSSRLKIKPWRAVDAQNGGVEARNGGLEGL
jgi:hypothetical protein